MNDWKRIALKVYLADAVIWASVLLDSAHGNDAFQRHRTLIDLVVVAVQDVVAALSWLALPLTLI